MVVWMKKKIEFLQRKRVKEQQVLKDEELVEKEVGLDWDSPSMCDVTVQ